MSATPVLSTDSQRPGTAAPGLASRGLGTMRQELRLRVSGQYPLHQVLSRVGQTVAAIVVVYTLVFVVVSALPGNPIENRVSNPDNGYSPAIAAQLEAYYGLDRHPLVQYLDRAGAALRADLGLSLADAKPVTQKIAEAALPTLSLAVLALVIAAVGAVGGALLALYSPLKFLRAVGNQTPSVINALPVYLVALVLIHIFSFQLGWFPLVGSNSLAAVVLPAIVLGVTISPSVSQVLLSSLKAAQDQQFTVVARAKGLKRVQILLHHLIPATATVNVTALGLLVAALLTGAVVTETVFSRPGLGKLMNDAVLGQDLPVIQGLILLVASIYLVINLLVDLLYPMLDPQTGRTKA